MESVYKNNAEVGNATSAMKTNNIFSVLEKEFYDAEKNKNIKKWQKSIMNY